MISALASTFDYQVPADLVLLRLLCALRQCLIQMLGIGPRPAGRPPDPFDLIPAQVVSADSWGCRVDQPDAGPGRHRVPHAAAGLQCRAPALQLQGLFQDAQPDLLRLLPGALSSTSAGPTVGLSDVLDRCAGAQRADLPLLFPDTQQSRLQPVRGCGKVHVQTP